MSRPKPPARFSRSEWRMIRIYMRHGRKRFRVLRSAETPMKRYRRGDA